jgi:hypothetical protein
MKRGPETVPAQREQQMRSGIMAPTMPASRVQIICRCNSLAHEDVPNNGHVGLIRPRALRRGGRFQTPFGKADAA